LLNGYKFFKLDTGNIECYLSNFCQLRVALRTQNLLIKILLGRWFVHEACIICMCRYFEIRSQAYWFMCRV